MTQNRIRELRKKHRYSQRQLGEAIGAAQTTVAGWENGKRVISLDVLKKIANVLGEPVASLVDEDTQELAENILNDHLEYIARSGQDISDYGGEQGLQEFALEEAQESAGFRRMEAAETNVRHTIEQEMRSLDAADMLRDIRELFENHLSPQGQFMLYQYAYMLYETYHAKR